MESCCAYFDPDYENYNARLFGARVNVDNESCEHCTVVNISSLTEQDLLLEVLQVLTDLDLCITKCYVSSDAGWFMDVFHVKDQEGNKVHDRSVFDYIQQAIGDSRLQEEQEPKKPDETMTSSSTSFSSPSKSDHELPENCTEIEMIGPNRPGIFSEISAVLDEQRCNIVEAHAWTHNDCLACVAKISSPESQITEPGRLANLEDHLSTVLHTGDVKARFLGGCSSPSHAESERRLHQLMLARRDFDPKIVRPRSEPNIATGSFSCKTDERNCCEEGRKTFVSIDTCNEKRYSVVNVECLDRRRLMFDTVCTLADLNYVVFHASTSTSSHGAFAFQEFYVRHKDGRILDSADERQLVIKCLEAAIERRICEGVRLELCTEINSGLLSYITRVLRENGLTVAHADIETKGDSTTHVLYVQELSGNTKIDLTIFDSVKQQLTPLSFVIKHYEEPPVSPRVKVSNGNSPEQDGFSFVGMLKSKIERISSSFTSI